MIEINLKTGTTYLFHCNEIYNETYDLRELLDFLWHEHHDESMDIGQISNPDDYQHHISDVDNSKNNSKFHISNHLCIE